MRVLLGFSILAIVSIFVINIAIYPPIISLICASNYTRGAMTRATFDFPMVDLMCARFRDAQPDLTLRNARGLADIARVSRAYSAQATNLLIVVTNIVIAINIARAIGRVVIMLADIATTSDNICAMIREYSRRGNNPMNYAHIADTLRDGEYRHIAIYVAYVACSNFTIYVAIASMILAMSVRYVFAHRARAQVPAMHIAPLPNVPILREVPATYATGAA